MKRFLAILLSALFIVSALPVMASAEGEATLTNVALGKVATASATTAAYEPYLVGYATDGYRFAQNSQQFIRGGSGWFCLDLGGIYTIDNIVLDAVGVNFTHYVDVYVSNAPVTTATGIPATAEKILTGSETTWDEAIKTIPAAKQGRYIIVHKSVDSSSALRIGEIEVYADEASLLVNVAANKPSFGGEVYIAGTVSYPSWQGNDGNHDTDFIDSDWSAGVPARYVIDLEKEYPIEAVVFVPRPNQTNEQLNFGIYATNDPLFVEKVAIHEQTTEAGAVGNGAHFYKATNEAFDTNKYRYIVMEKIEKTTSENNLSVKELEVYTADAAAKVSTAADRAYVISTNSPVSSDCGEGSYAFSNMTDTETSTTCLVSTANASGYLSVDLLKPQTIDYVTYAIKGYSYYHYGMEVVASNNQDLSNGVVLYSANDDDGTYFCPVSDANTNGILLFPATAEMAGNKYRYVGIRFPFNTTTSTQLARGGASLFEVYTKGGNLQESVSGVAFTQNGTTFSASIADMVTVTNSAYTFIATGYDAYGNLIDFKTANIEKPNQYKRNITAITASVDFADSEKKADIATVKTMVWDNLDNIRPIVEEESFKIEAKYVAHESTAATTSYNFALYNSGWTQVSSSNYMTDGLVDDATKTIGRGSGADMVWIDLGEAKQIDAVKVHNLDPYATYPTTNTVFYVTNEAPTLAALNEITNTDKKFTAVPSTWVAVNGSGYSWKTSTDEVFCELSVGGEYRYVIVIDPTSDYNPGKGVPVNLAEITAYEYVNDFAD